MSIYHLSRKGDCVRVEGSADHLTSETIRALGDGFQDIMISSLIVTKVGDGQHDGAAARVFTLSDETKLHEIGRLVVVVTQSLEWYEVYESSERAQERVDTWRMERTRLATAALDFAWDGYPTLEIGIAETAAEFGVSIKVLQVNGPGGGWPEIEVTGLRNKVEHLLRKGWQMGDQEVTDAIGR